MEVREEGMEVQEETVRGYCLSILDNVLGLFLPALHSFLCHSIFLKIQNNILFYFIDVFFLRSIIQ